MLCKLTSLRYNSNFIFHFQENYTSKKLEMSTIEIVMGFEPIEFDHSMISPEQKSNGSRLLNAGKIYNVVEIRRSGLSRLSEIRASAVRPVMVMDLENSQLSPDMIEPYSISMGLNENRVVTSAFCSCGAVNGQCKHVYGTMLHINKIHDSFMDMYFM